MVKRRANSHVCNLVMDKLMGWMISLQCFGCFYLHPFSILLYDPLPPIKDFARHYSFCQLCTIKKLFSYIGYGSWNINNRNECSFDSRRCIPCNYEVYALTKHKRANKQTSTRKKTTNKTHVKANKWRKKNTISIKRIVVLRHKLQLRIEQKNTLRMNYIKEFLWALWDNQMDAVLRNVRAFSLNLPLALPPCRPAALPPCRPSAPPPHPLPHFVVIIVLSSRLLSLARIPAHNTDFILRAE